MKQLSAITLPVSPISSHSSRKGRKAWLVVAIAAMLMLTTAAGDSSIPSSLLQEQDAARYNALGHRMMCTCGCEQVLLECNHDRFGLGPCETAIRMRGELRAALLKHDNDDAILRSFAQKYGAAALKSRGVKDVSKLAWLLGFAVAATTGLIAIVFVRKRRSKEALVTTPLSEWKDAEMDMLRRRVRAATEDDEW
jgi:cytochrome c-type biogenesis protein CcmH/NrfF